MSEEDSPELRGIPYMPLHGDRLFKSETWIKASAEAKVAMLRLWWQAFAHEKPMGTLPDDDYLLADYAGYGVMVDSFRKIKEQAMRGFVVGDDGRLHHEFVKEVAQRAWSERQRSRKRQADFRARQASENSNGNVTGMRNGNAKSGADETTPAVPSTTPENPSNRNSNGNVTRDNDHLLPLQSDVVTVTEGTGIGIGIAKEVLKPSVGQKPDGAVDKSEKLKADRKIGERVIKHLNEKAGTKYQASESHLKLIRGRINGDGATEELLCRVVDEKCAQSARGEFDRKWLSPDTLFNATKFAKYVGQLDSVMPAPTPAQQQRMVLILGETPQKDVGTITTFSHIGELDGFDIAKKACARFGGLVNQKGYRYILIEQAGSQVKLRYSVEELRNE